MKTNAAFQLWNALTQETVSDDSARTLPLGFVALGSDVPLVAYRHPAHPPTPSASAVAKFLREWADALDWTVPVPVPEWDVIELKKRVTELEAENARLKRADMWWDWDDAEEAITELDEFFANTNAGEGAVFCMEAAARLPTEYYTIVTPANDDEENYRPSTPEEIAEYKAARKKRQSS